MINLFRFGYLLPTLFINIYGDGINESLWEPDACKIPEDGNNKNFKLLKNGTEIDTEYESEVGQMPWMTILWSSNSTPVNITCSGTLINRYYVLTAAACGNSSDMVRLGENDLSHQVDCDKSGNCAPPPQDIKIRKYIIPEDNSLSAIIELETPVQFNDFVRPACIDDTTDDLASNRAFQDDELIVGWYGENKLRSGNSLMYVNTRRISMEKCQETFSSQKNIAYCLELGKSMTRSSSNGLPNKNLGSPVIIRKSTASNRFIFSFIAAIATVVAAAVTAYSATKSAVNIVSNVVKTAKTIKEIKKIKAKTEKIKKKTEDEVKVTEKVKAEAMAERAKVEVEREKIKHEKSVTKDKLKELKQLQDILDAMENGSIDIADIPIEWVMQF